MIASRAFMLKKRASTTAIFLLGSAPLLAGVSPVLAQSGGLNPDTLSFLEKPLAFEIFGATVNYNQLIDVPLVHDFNAKDTDIHPRSNFQMNIERQMRNALTLGATYFGSHDEKNANKHEDRWGAYVSGVWGRASGGEVNASVRVATRRWRGTGNAALEFDDVLGTLGEDDFGAAYQLRISAFTLNAGADENGHSDFGITYERPNRTVDIRATGRFTNSEISSADGATIFDTYAGSLTGQVEKGSFAADIGLGYEHFESTLANGVRMFISTGLHYKIRKLTLSAEGYWGEIDGDTEKSTAFGARYDLARGLSLNLGYNYANSDAAIDGVTIQSVDMSEVLGSLRYEF